MNHRMLFALSFLFLTAGYLIRSIHSAYASPQGPVISHGSNPIDHQMLECSSSEQFSNTQSTPFIITDVVAYSSNYQLILRIDGDRVAAFHADSDVAASTGHRFQSGLKVESGQVVSCTASVSSRFITISGYYAHP